MTTRYHGHFWRSESNGQWYWHVQHVNGKVVCQGEGYENESDMHDTLSHLFETRITFELIDDPAA